MLRVLGLAVALAAVLSIVAGTAPRHARAHVGADVQGVLFHPSLPDVIVANAIHGYLISEDGGATWDWICLQALDEARVGFTDPAILGQDGSLFAARTSGLFRGAAFGCEWSPAAAALDDMFVADVTRAASGDIYTLESETATENAVYRSSDGIAFAPLAGRLPAGFLPERVRVAPSDPMRIYVSGSYPPAMATAERFFVYASSDRGATWDAHEIALDDEERGLFLLDVDAANAERIFAWAKGDASDRLLMSTDGGATFETIQRIAVEGITNRTFAFALAPDGTMYYGNTRGGGLFSATSSTDIRSIDRDLSVSCLAIRDGELWVCANAMMNGFAIAKSPLPDIAFEPVLTFDEVIGPRQCEVTPALTARCDLCWEDQRIDFGLRPMDTGITLQCITGFTDAGPPDAGPTLDATPDASRGGAVGGGGCAVTPGRTPPPLLLLALLPLTRRRR